MGEYMGINIINFDINKEKVTYEIVPEKIPLSVMEELKQYKKMNSENNGYSMGKTMRLIGKIPQEVLYNYAISKGCHPTKINDFYSEKNKKNIKKLLEEFPCFKMVDKL